MRGCLQAFGILFLLIFGVGIFGASVSSRNTTSPSTPTATVPAAATPQEDLEPYSDELRRMIADVKATKATPRWDSLQDVAITLAVIDMWALTLDKGATRTLSDEEATLYSELLSQTSAKQRQLLPIVRDQYGPIMRQELWEADGKARTVGAGYRTVKFIAGEFAANRNIKSTHEAAYETLMRLRLTRAEYHWLDSDYAEYQYYTLKPPSDGDVVIWTGSRFREVRQN